MPITQRQSRSDLAKVSQESSLEHSTFSTKNRTNIFKTPTPNDKKTEKLVAGLNKMNLSKHLTANKLVNLPQSVDDLAGGLNRIKLDVVNRLKSGSKDLEKAKKDKRRLHEKLEQARQELAQTHERLASLRDEYTVIEKELDWVQGKLVLTQAQRLKLLDELRAVNKENLNLQKQLAGGVASVTADPVANYRSRGIGPKNQLTGTDPTAYALWRWAVNDKLRVDAVMYPEERDRISYAFHQLAQPFFQ